MKKFYALGIILFLTLGFFFSVYLNRNKQETILNSKNIEYNNGAKKRSPYTLEELYNFTEENSWPSDSIEIYENWYDYFSSSTPFINIHGEEINYEEYVTIKNYAGNNLFKKIIFLPRGMLEGKYF